MTRQEIYDKIFKLLEKEQFHIQNRYDFGEIDIETFEELARCNDKDLKDKMSFIINADIDVEPF